MIALMLLGGFALLVAGGEGLVRGASALALRAGISPLLVGLTVVGFGTSAPEMLTSVQAALAGSPGIAVGNVVGSNIVNILLILGLAAVILPVPVGRAAFRRDGTAVVLATALGVAICLIGEVGRLSGLVLLAGLAAYLYIAWKGERDSGGGAEPDLEGAGLSPLKAALYVLAGLVALVVGASLLVDGAIELARGLGVSETVIGLTVVAVGTSLPELVTSVMAALKRQSDLAFGNVLGSNIFNILGILGVTALVSPLSAPPEILKLDVWVMSAATLALILVCVTSWRISRLEGALMMAVYAAYVAWLAGTA